MPNWSRNLLAIVFALYVVVLPPAHADVDTAVESPAESALLLRQFEKAAAELTVLAENGNIEALYRLAGLYIRGLGVPRDVDRAREIYTSLAADGHVPSKAALARSSWDESSFDISGEQGRLRLIWAAERGDLDSLDRILAGGINVNATGTFGRTALIEATDAVARLLEHGADPDLADVSGDTALIHGARRDRSEIVDLLLAAGADPSRAGQNGNTALIVAAQKGHSHIADSLIDSGANLNAENAEGYTALAIARVRNNGSVEASLVAHDAVAAGFETRSRSSLGGLRLDQQVVNGRPVWFIAADRGNWQAIKSLLRAGANPDQRDASGETALTIAASRGYTDVARLLLENGASISARGAGGATPVEIAAHNNQAQTLGVLLAAGGKTGKAPIMAADAGAADSMFILLQNRGLTKSVDESGATPLILAARHRDDRILRQLLAVGSDPETQDRLGRTAIWYAAANGNESAILALAAAGASSTAADSNGDTPLHAAARAGHQPAVTALSRSDGLVELPNGTGMTPLMLAALNGHDIVTELLANAGHDANARNNAGNTALHLASQRGDAEIVRLLLGIGASRREINDARMNAEDLAERFGHDAVAAALDGN